MKIEEGPKTNSRTSLHLQAFWKEVGVEQHILLSLIPGENVVGFLWVGPATVSSLEGCRDAGSPRATTAM